MYRIAGGEKIYEYIHRVLDFRQKAASPIKYVGNFPLQALLNKFLSAIQYYYWIGLNDLDHEGR